MKKYEAIKISVLGRVQGVGFRPFVFALAEKFSIKGTVQNNMDGVKIIAEGIASSLEAFVSAIKDKKPRLAKIIKLSVENIELRNFIAFTIVESDRGGTSSLVIPIDSAVCDDCLEEMSDPTNFRYQYFFINCTQCGPRYTIIKELPYDRPYTTMTNFALCDNCNKEYQDPLNRRHHAQPIACPSCGPTVTLTSTNGEVLKKGSAAIETTKKLLKAGKIVAIKGIGGYHLACNAYDAMAINTLRVRKNRPHRPLAIMAATVPIIERIAYINEVEKKVLESPEAPIVVVTQREKLELANLIAPGMKTIGLFLPYTPLHKLLFMNSDLDLLIMTSANPSGLPMLYKDSEAVTYLNGIADFILTSNRDIEHPVDDSVVQVVDRELQFFRRARGYAPDPLMTKKIVEGLIALGPQQKNTFAIGRHEQIFIGPHIGDMGSIEVTNHYLNEMNHLLKWLGVEPKSVAIDMHPLYETTKMATEMKSRKIISVQHHHAHHVSCMEDNQLSDPCFGIILDGTGYGEDGHIWGFELLYGDARGYKRLGHLGYSPLPGGEKAVKEPWRNAVGMLVSQFGFNEGVELSNLFFPKKQSEIEMIAMMIKKQLNSPLAGTCGRLFDAVSALLGICEVSTYEGEAAIRLSELVSEKDDCRQYYPFQISVQKGLSEVSSKEILRQVINDVLSGTDTKKVALKFHQTIVEICFELLTKAVTEKPLLNKTVVLSGGSFHNRYLLHHLVKNLKKANFQVFTHKNVSCNDGGVSLGQLMIASEQLSSVRGGNVGCV